MRDFQPYTRGPASTVHKFNNAVDGLNELNTIASDMFIQVQRTAHGYTIGLNLPMLLQYIPKTSGGGSVAAVDTWAEVMHAVDDQADYYDIKLSAWAAEWSANMGACVAEDLEAQPPVAPTIVRKNNREWQCLINHTASNDHIPGEDADYWGEVEQIKCYAKGDVECLSTCIPQFAPGEKRQVCLYTPEGETEARYYFRDTFIQCGIFDSETELWGWGSIVWNAATLTTKGRALGAYRDLP